jgi:hypothetical protein
MGNWSSEKETRPFNRTVNHSWRIGIENQSPSHHPLTRTNYQQTRKRKKLLEMLVYLQRSSAKNNFEFNLDSGRSRNSLDYSSTLKITERRMSHIYNGINNLSL